MQRRSESRAASAKLVYIGGYGRSGSTLLEYLLAAHPEVVACGEIERHLRVFARRRTCTCGEPARHCQVWGEFQHKSGRLEGLDHPTQLTSSRSYLPPVCGHGRFVEDGVGLYTHAVPLIKETRQGFSPRPSRARP